MTIEEALRATLLHRLGRVGVEQFLDELASLLLLTRAQQKAVLKPRVQAYRNAITAPTETTEEIDAIDQALTALS